MKVLFFTKPKKHTLDCVKFLVEAGAEIYGIVIYGKDNFQNTEFVKYCKSQNLPVYDGEDIYNYLEEIDGKVDVIFCNTYPKLIRSELLKCSKLGGYNFHMAPLPEYKGVFGFNFAIYNGETKYGVTCHKLSDDFDQGDIVKVQYFDIDPECITVKKLVNKAEEETLLLFKNIYDALDAGETLQGVPQKGGHYYSRKEFIELRKIKENDSKEEIARKIKAFWYPPYEGAYICINGIRYTLVDEKTLFGISRDE